jgi:hypothetical protein
MSTEIPVESGQPEKSESYERAANLNKQLAVAAIGETVSPPVEAIPTAEEIESRFDITFLLPIEINGASTYAVTRAGINKFFADKNVSHRQVQSAWENLAHHSRTLHDPLKESRSINDSLRYLSCSCQLQPFFGKGMIDSPKGRGIELIGINPIGLATVLPYLESLHTGFKSRFRPQTKQTLSIFVSGITK